MIITRLNEIANEYECEVVLGNEFAYYYRTNTIVVNVEDTDTTFLTFAKSIGLEVNIDNFLFSFFHELGHNETIDEVETFVEDTTRLSNEEYYNLEEEIIATEWAIDFCNAHKELIE